ncbi:lysophospholipid acyltransferase family protein [Limibaculum sp. FT325]|uniref:lysophospholipid acyltransferase family protein n=1 Tax=Thermohalobaculum sediminis TaxID=2939436 RepID=UPI0020C1572D|nr:lysophospholipid acyltransferase family protein [Limibaculum sediminis]MCL5778831.1 lysophospholipid acyltransferase family protein [Limibaculum sediminis]
MAGPGASILRGLRHSAIGRRALAALGAFYIWLVLRTTRWQVEGGEHLDAVVSRGGGFIPCLWHGRLMMSPTWAPPGRRTVAMISNNADGDLIAAIVGWFGVHTVRGSTYDKAKRRDKGGRAAYHGAEAELTEHAAVVAITPDGPRGPRMHAQAGAAMLSIETRAPILPVAFSARRGWVLRSWDRFFVPAPFGRGALVYGAPLDPPPAAGGDVEAYRAAIEHAVTAVTDRADALMGRARILPAGSSAKAAADLPGGGPGE